MLRMNERDTLILLQIAHTIYATMLLRNSIPDWTEKNLPTILHEMSAVYQPSCKR